MSKKLRSGDTLPAFTLNLVGGGSVTLPDDLSSDFGVVLFYRGHWWPFCRRQLAGFEAKKADLAALGVTVYAASVDSGEHAAEVAADISYDLGEGVSRDTAEEVGGWWNEERGIVQPTQFLFRKGGAIVQSTYSDGPLGRLDADDVAGLVGFLKSS